MGHVNVRAYAEFFEEACWQYYAIVGITPSRLRAGEIHVAAVRQDTAYLRELLGGDVVVVRTATLEVRPKVLRFLHAMTNLDTGETCATSEFTVVCLDPQARRSRAYPDDVLQRARGLLPSA